jgi:hypothetical protein
MPTTTLTKPKLNPFLIASYILLATGIVIRVYHYLVNRSLWLDEAMLSNNIIDRSFSQLLEPLDKLQIAPIGFLFTQKVAVLFLGTNEYALRLFPLFVRHWFNYFTLFLAKKDSQ